MDEPREPEVDELEHEVVVVCMVEVVEVHEETDEIYSYMLIFQQVLERLKLSEEHEEMAQYILQPSLVEVAEDEVDQDELLLLYTIHELLLQ